MPAQLEWQVDSLARHIACFFLLGLRQGRGQSSAQIFQTKTSKGLVVVSHLESADASGQIVLCLFLTLDETVTWLWVMLI